VIAGDLSVNGTPKIVWMHEWMAAWLDISLISFLAGIH